MADDSVFLALVGISAMIMAFMLIAPIFRFFFTLPSQLFGDPIPSNNNELIAELSQKIRKLEFSVRAGQKTTNIHQGDYGGVCENDTSFYLFMLIVIAVTAGITYLLVKQNINNSTNTSLNCAICCEADKNCIFEPCHHMFACITCANAWKRTTDVCPVCHRHVAGITQVYLKNIRSS